MGCCGEKRKSVRPGRSRPAERLIKPSLTGGTLRGESAPTPSSRPPSKR